jgi:hypothetical protein
MQIAQQQNPPANRKVAIGVLAIFVAEFVSLFFAQSLQGGK